MPRCILLYFMKKTIAHTRFIFYKFEKSTRHSRIEANLFQGNRSSGLSIFRFVHHSIRPLSNFLEPDKSVHAGARKNGIFPRKMPLAESIKFKFTYFLSYEANSPPSSRLFVTLMIGWCFPRYNLIGSCERLSLFWLAEYSIEPWYTVEFGQWSFPIRVRWRRERSILNFL